MTIAAALLGAGGTTLALTARDRQQLIAGLAMLGGAVLLILPWDGIGGLSASVVAAGLAGLACVTGLGLLFVRHPAWALPALVVAAPLRLPIATDSSAALGLRLVKEGGLGRLYPLYVVLGAALVALCVRLAQREPVRALARGVAWPLAALVALSALSLTWTQDEPSTRDALAFFWLPFVALAVVAAHLWDEQRDGGRLARLVVGIGLALAAIAVIQWLSRGLFFYTPQLAVTNGHGPLFRVTGVFQDPSHLGRFLVVAMALVVAAIWTTRIRLAVAVATLAGLGIGLYFTYSQTSMLALAAVTIAVMCAAGGRIARGVAVLAIGGAVVLGASVVVSELRGERAADVTRNRSTLVLDTAQVAARNPGLGVGLGAQPRITRNQERPGTTIGRNASHTTPVTVAAELGIPGLVAYVALILGLGLGLLQIIARDRTLGLGLGACLVALATHSIFYAGFFDNPLTWGLFALVAVASADEASIDASSARPATA